MFTGHQWDGESGLYYAPFRYYSPFQARWTTRDPLGMVDGPNVYAYVRGNPVGFSDPLGLRMEDCMSGFENCVTAGIASHVCTRCMEFCRGQGFWPTANDLFGQGLDGFYREGKFSCGPGPSPLPLPVPQASPERVSWGVLGGGALIATGVALAFVPGGQLVGVAAAAAGVAVIGIPPRQESSCFRPGRV